MTKREPDFWLVFQELEFVLIIILVEEKPVPCLEFDISHKSGSLKAN